MLTYTESGHLFLCYLHLSVHDTPELHNNLAQSFLEVLATEAGILQMQKQLLCH